MNNKMQSTIIIALVAAFIAGCAKAPPKCSDENTLSLIRQIIVGQLGWHVEIAGVSDENIHPNMKIDLQRLSDKELQDNMRIEFPRAIAFDEKIKKYSCEAKLIAGGAVELPITYESQLDDKDQHIVSVGGIARGDLIDLRFALGGSVMKGRGLKDNSASPPSQSTSQAESTSTPSDDKQVTTQYGQLSIVGDSGEMQLMFNGKKLRDGSDFILSFEKRFISGNHDVILVMNNSGGTACPAQHFFVTINSASDVQLSPEFGTCSDLIEVSQTDENIIVTMPESAGQKVQYIYSSGVVSENGKPLR